MKELAQPLVARMRSIELDQLGKIYTMQRMLVEARARAEAILAQEDAQERPSEATNTIIRGILEQYFQAPADSAHATAPEEAVPLSPSQRAALRSDIRALAASQPPEMQLTARAITRLFHGIQSPRFPARMWASTPTWKQYSHVPFPMVLAVAQEVLNAR